MSRQGFQGNAVDVRGGEETRRERSKTTAAVGFELARDVNRYRFTSLIKREPLSEKT